MRRLILSVTFPDTTNVGRVLVVDGIIDRTSINMKRWYGDTEDAFRDWCHEHNLVTDDTYCPNVECHTDYNGFEIEAPETEKVL